MREPHRVQLSRKRGWKMPANTVSVSRPGKWGNPYKVGEELASIPFVDDDYPARHYRTAQEAVECYRDLLSTMLPNRPDLNLSELRGKNLACWCPLPKDGEPDLCHASVLLELANAPAAEDSNHA